MKFEPETLGAQLRRQSKEHQDEKARRELAQNDSASLKALENSILVREFFNKVKRLCEKQILDGSHEVFVHVDASHYPNIAKLLQQNNGVLTTSAHPHNSEWKQLRTWGRQNELEFSWQMTHPSGTAHTIQAKPANSDRL